MIHLMEVEELKKLISKKEVCLIDVREQEEYNQSNIEDSILIPLATLTLEKIKQVAQEGKKLVIHCKSGGRSLRACQGLTDEDSNLEVYNLEGGITAWNLLNGSSSVNKNDSTSSGSCS